MHRLSSLLAALAIALPTTARAQLFDSSRFFGSGLGRDTLQGAAPYGNPIPDNRVYIHGFFDQLEGRIGRGSCGRRDGQAWIGDDHNRLWLKSDGPGVPYPSVALLACGPEHAARLKAAAETAAIVIPRVVER